VLSGRLAAEQVERPPGRDAPGNVDAGQPFGDLQRVPRVSRGILPDLDPAGWQLFVVPIHGYALASDENFSPVGHISSFALALTGRRGRRG
jgi:hypothetical protein